MTAMDASTAAAVAEAFALGELVGLPQLADAGEQGRIWRVTTGRGRWAVKEVPGPLDEVRADRCIRFRELAALRVTVPTPVRTTDGRAILDGSPVGAAGSGFLAFAWLDLDSDAATTPFEVGRAAAALHLVDLLPDTAVEPWVATGLSDDDWQHLVAAAERGGAPWRELLVEMLPTLRELRGVVTELDPARVRTCHRDLNVVNVRRSRSGAVVVLDWDNVGPMDPARELAELLVVQTLGGQIERAIDLYDAYVTAGGPARIRDLSDFSAVSIRAEQLIRQYALRWLDASATPEERSFAAHQLEWILAAREPISLRSISALLRHVSERRGGGCD
ncbi:MAG: aminoglycoside phosphotransferase family protein [Actinobacteria bacterium]|nr:aminoglycoside phosphotransferase family protein [Actinomycetota bacterium]